MKILVISGFLGAGKTTFIKTMSEKTGRDFCVFENEYAQADIDKALLTQSGEMNIWELTENCICCSGKQDFASSILTISNTIDPEYLLVEPTGVAKLSAILDNIRKIQYERISLLKPVTILDGNLLETQQKEFADIYIDQIQNSELILLSKCENMTPQEREELQEKIRKWNPQAQVLTEHYSEMDISWWKMLLGRNVDGTFQTVENQEEETQLETIALNKIQIPTMNHLISFLEMVTFGVFGEICRAKGYLPCGKDWVYFEIVDHTYSITGIEPQEQAQGVFIGSMLYRPGLREILTPYYEKNRFHKAVRMKDPFQRTIKV